ncbi:MAG TPA: DMT family transporter [Sandaracinaceae bacterium LLY-WYZ-13_1]|nr:DMT family transporter [Sandaracinaceae bacterium LLY-WYZ-13_1]
MSAASPTEGRRGDDRARRVPFALGAAIASISFAAIFIRLASPTHPLIVAGGRLAIAALLLAVPTVRGWRAGRLPPRVLTRAALCGLLYALHFGTWVTSLSLTSVASSVTLVTATPLLLALLSFATGKDRPEGRHWLSIGLAVVGLTLIGWADLSFGAEALLGDALAFAGAAAMAFYLLVVRGLGEDLDVLAFGGVATLVGAAVLVLAALAAGVPLAFASLESAGWVALAALVPQLVGHNLLTWALRHATPTAVGIATVGEPVGATLLAWIWLGEPLDTLVGLGCAVTLIAVLLSLRIPRSPDGDPRPV